MNEARRVLREVVFGVLEGLAMYLIFVVAIPWFLSNVAGIRIPDEEVLDSISTLFYLGVFISLGVAASVLKPPIGLVFEAISAVLALTIILKFVGQGVFREVVEHAGVVMNVEFEIRTFILIPIGFTVVNSIVRMFERLVSLEE